MGLLLNRFMIFNPNTGAFKCSNGARTLPALYATRAIAQGVLKQSRAMGRLKNFVVIEVEVKNKHEW